VISASAQQRFVPFSEGASVQPIGTASRNVEQFLWCDLEEKERGLVRLPFGRQFPLVLAEGHQWKAVAVIVIANVKMIGKARARKMELIPGSIRFLIPQQILDSALHFTAVHLTARQ